MAVPSIQYDESKPAGSRKINLGDNDIRELKTQIREIIAVDHEMIATQTLATGGQHKQVTLQDAADIGTGATGVPILGAQGAEDSAELTYTNEADTDIVITNQTGIKAPSITGVYAAANLAAVATIGALLYPVGSLYFNDEVSTNPGTLLGFGTWTAITEKFIIGVGADADFDTAKETGGAKTYDISHDHGGDTGGVVYGTADGATSAGTLDTKHDQDISSDGSATQSVMNPYYAAYIWRRAS